MHDYRLARDYDIVDTYNKVIAMLGRDARTMMRDEIFEYVTRQPAKQFYISYQEAKKNVSLLLRNLPIPIKSEFRRQMYLDIAILALDRHKQHPEVSILDHVCDVVDSEAPSFYLSRSSIEQRYNETIKRIQRDNKKQLQRCA